ncbi:hypothetical protein NVV93_14595 [Pseudomonas sp. LS44]|uniref:hypothetical protein n=1 Tax=Pseudomonas sp. LS44 TaxID=1357074 RepID=UPI00215A3B8F|nr:hypothetical protein [Pseudomonas sp. LS44]UVE16815.1 hypothetical protein NVV93_14595 [Pseudomonas sp. LS44]
MSAAEVLEIAEAEGVSLVLEGDRLTWKADHQPPADLLAEIKAHRLEIIEALTPANDSPEALAWLGRVARLLGCSPAYLRERGFIDRHDLEEQHRTHPRFTANLIRSNPAWIPQTDHLEHLEQHQPQYAHRTAATASPEWIAARDAFHAHALGNCPHCHAPTGRYCVTGAELRARYLSAGLQ